MKKMYLIIVFVIALVALIYLRTINESESAIIMVPALVFCVMSFFSKNDSCEREVPIERRVLLILSCASVALILLILFALDLVDMSSLLLYTAIVMLAIACFICWRLCVRLYRMNKSTENE